MQYKEEARTGKLTIMHTANRLTCGLLAIFMGSCGLHKFYGGKAGQGIIYILFSWTFIPFIISLIEGIAVLLAVEDENGCILIK